MIARDRTCRMPGCGRPARRCQIDHCRARSDGGATCERNLHCLCARHHTLKHEAGWTITRDPLTLVTTWTSPTGRVHAKHPETLPIDTTALGEPWSDRAASADLPEDPAASGDLPTEEPPF